MHDIKRIREDADLFDEGLRARGVVGLDGVPEGERPSATVLALDDRRRALIQAAQALQERRNAASKEIGRAMAVKDAGAAEALKAEVAGLKDRLGEAERAAEAGGKALNDLLLAIPNAPAADVPVGADEHGNVEHHRVGAPRREGEGLDFPPRQHFDLGEAMGLMDFEAAARMSGARFVVTKGGLARLERALGQFMLDLHTGKQGYQEVNPPLLVRDHAMFGTAQLPKFVDDQFRTGTGYQSPDGIVDMVEICIQMADDIGLITNARSGETEEFHALVRKRFDLNRNDDLWLIPTAEVPLTNLVRESILDAASLPLRFAALTPCFRAEAGAAGRDTRGMIRQHQFTKCELVSITAPEGSEAEHERMLGCAEEVLKRLDLAFRTVTLCTGDMGFAARKTYDIEVWLPGQGAYREISSCSNCGDFQARRMAARYRPPGEKGTAFVHTLNGSGVAVGRALVAVLETYQNEDGSVTVPDALLPYMGGLTRIGGAA